MSSTSATCHIIGGGIAGLSCAWLIKQKRPDIFIVFTDGENIWKDCKPYIVRGMKYIIISTHDSSLLDDIDFGEVIVINES